MKFTVLLAAAMAAVATFGSVTEASDLIPKEHHGRFLSEREVLLQELDAWKNSAAGRTARANGYYKEVEADKVDDLDDHLARFFLSKLAIEDVQAANPNATFTLNTPFALMTRKEFGQFVKHSFGLHHKTPAANVTEVAAPSRNLRASATSVDWTTGSCVAAVKDQGQCGSCWSFSAISTLESAICLKTGKLTTLSEQQLVSCDKNNDGCNGGMIDTALTTLQTAGKWSTEASYPYRSGTTETDGTCTDSRTTHSKLSYTISSVHKVAATEAAFIAAINTQPLGVSIAADNNEFQYYESGVLSSCSSTELDHAVVAVGYDATSFKIRNSWGASWGDNGYVRLARKSATKAACGVINTDATYPIVA